MNDLEWVHLPIFDFSRNLTLTFASAIFSIWAAFSFAMAAFNSAFANSWVCLNFKSVSISCNYQRYILFNKYYIVTDNTNSIHVEKVGKQ